jgi:phage tail-like protein
VSKVSALKQTTEVVNHREGGENSTDHKSPGRTSYEAITLERGITHDIEFEKWANMVHPYAGDTAMDLVNYKKELVLEVMNEKGHVALRYFLHNCWVSEFTAVPDLDANANAVAIENLKIELEGWERDIETKEPDEAAPVPPPG